MVSNMCIFLLWSLAKKATWVIEQPGSSLMWQHPRVRQVRDLIEKLADPMFTYCNIEMTMGAYGAPTVKPSQLHACANWVKGLERHLSDEERARIRASSTEEVVTKDPVTGAVTGGSDLKGTQEYPRDYGSAVAEQWLQWQQRAETLDVDVDETHEELKMPAFGKDTWQDTSLDAVCKLLGIPSDQLLG